MSFAKMFLFTLTTLVAAFTFSTGCATLNYTAQLSLQETSQISDIYKKAETLTDKDIKDLQVYDIQDPDGLPAGMQIVQKDGRPAFTWDRKMYEAVANASSYQDYELLDSFGWRFYPYLQEENWRNYYCHAQVPLNWLSVGLYRWVSPIFWPCNAWGFTSNADDAVAERKQIMRKGLKKLAHAAGAEILIISYRNEMYYDAQTGEEQIAAMANSANGFFLKKVSQ